MHGVSLNGLRWERSYYPSWMVALMVLLFPIGLVLLPAKQTSAVVMRVAPNAHGSDVAVVHEESAPGKKLQAALRDAACSYLPAPLSAVPVA